MVALPSGQRSQKHKLNASASLLPTPASTPTPTPESRLMIPRRVSSTASQNPTAKGAQSAYASSRQDDPMVLLRKEFAYSVYLTCVGFWVFTVFAVAWFTLMGNLGSLGIIPLIVLFSSMGVHLFGQTWGLRPWTIHLFSLALGFCTPFVLIFAGEFHSILSFN